MSTSNNQLDKNKQIEASEKLSMNNGEPQNAKATVEGSNVIRGVLGQLSEGINLNEKPSEVASEKASENYSRSQGTTGGHQQDDNSEEIKKLHAQLKASKPKKGVMVKEIKRVLKSEERKLMKESRKYIKNRAFASLNAVVTKIRQIHQMLEELAYATYDAIKNMWLKMVHNISI